MRLLTWRTEKEVAIEIIEQRGEETGRTVYLTASEVFDLIATLAAEARRLLDESS